MKKIKFLVLTITLILALAACGQGATNNTKEVQESTLATAPANEEQEEKNTGAGVNAKEPAEPVTEIEVLDAIYLYFSHKDLMNIYRVEDFAQYTKDEEGIQKALQRWILGPKQEGLQSSVPKDVVVQSVEDRAGVAYISFSNELLDANLGSSGEAMLAEQIVMVVEQFGYNEVFLLINGEVIDSLLGHVDWSEPFSANSPEEYELYNE